MNNITPNLFAYTALLIWPVVTLYLYSRYPIGRATLWTILAAYLLLPAGAEIKFQMIPAFSKLSIPNLAALIGCTVCAQRFPRFFHGLGLVEILIWLILIGPFITSMLNTDPIRIGPTVLPGVGVYDAGSAAIAEFIFFLPFFLGRQFLRRVEDNSEILRSMAVAGLAYSLPMLFEVRMSPQLSSWIYGYSPQSILVEIRNVGFRPVVFLTNGLLVAFFAMTTTVAAAALWRTEIRIGRLRFGWITAYLSFVLLLCKSLGALVYGAILVPLVRWADPRLQIRVACVLVIIALSYPMLRVTEMFPTTSLLEIASAVDTERAASLATRFIQEDRLLEHALDRPMFGWGRFGRSRVYESETGLDVSITDGFWIITMGTFGLVGFVAQFGLLGLSVFRAARALKFAQSMREGVFLAALALVVAINMVDLLPNSSLSPWTWLLAGALLGRAEMLRATSDQRILLSDSHLSSVGVTPNA